MHQNIASWLREENFESEFEEVWNWLLKQVSKNLKLQNEKVKSVRNSVMILVSLINVISGGF